MWHAMGFVHIFVFLVQGFVQVCVLQPKQPKQPWLLERSSHKLAHWKGDVEDCRMDDVATEEAMTFIFLFVGKKGAFDELFIC